jgi:glycosyltransferase involved in cell wall biosynthesis
MDDAKAKINVSVAVITKNEERLIGRCLDSVQWSDDIIVVDGMSADRTAEIARSKGARVAEHKFTGSFADDRNLGTEMARNEWVLHIDADDVVTEGFRRRMAEALAKGGKVDVYKFRRRNFFLGHSMDHGGFHHYIPNLVRKGAVRYEGAVHEVPVYRGAEGTIEADIDHHPFDSIQQFIDRQSRYAGIAAGQMLETEGVMDDKAIRKGILAKSFKVFWKSYVKKQGYRDGLYGLVFAILFAFINFLKWAKYWELVSAKREA